VLRNIASGIVEICGNRDQTTSCASRVWVSCLLEPGMGQLTNQLLKMCHWMGVTGSEKSTPNSGEEAKLSTKNALGSHAFMVN